MAKGSDSIAQLTAAFAKMPGIGVRTAERLAYYVQSLSTEDARALVEAIRTVKTRAVVCSQCFNISETDPCPICSGRGRDRSTLCAVERVQDLAVIESSGSYRGLYHVLGGRIAPLEGVYPEDLTIRQLVERARGEEVKEVIIATNPDTEGDSTAHYVMDQLAPVDVEVSVLARGIPAGGRLEHTAQGTLAGALSGRRSVKAKGNGT